jgi:hypothetical protein
MVAALLTLGRSARAEIGCGWKGERLARRFAAVHPWHANYYHTEWGQPLALVVPPTVRMTNSWSWGVAQSEMRPLYHQFQRNYPGEMVGGAGLMSAGGGGFYPTPIWPSHTDQFGVYYIRGPW